MPDGVDGAAEWARFVAEYKRNKMPWETPGHPFMYEAFATHVIMMEEIGERLDIPEWMRQRHGLMSEHLEQSMMDALFNELEEVTRE